MADLVELKPAYLWDCPECARENFERAISIDPQSDMAAELDEQFEDERPDGEWVMAPESVTCRHCGAVFPAKHWAEEDQ